MTTDHKCIQETRITVQESNYTHLRDEMRLCAEKLDDVLKLLQGGNGVGVMTNIELLKESTKRLWGFFILLAGALVAGLAKIFYKGD